MTTQAHSIRLRTRKEAAAFLNISPVTLAKWDAKGPPPLPHVRVGSRVMYRLDDLEDFIRRNTHGAVHSERQVSVAEKALSAASRS